MMNFNEMYEMYKATGLNNYTLNCLSSNNKYEREHAINTLKKHNINTTDDLLLFIAMNI